MKKILKICSLLATAGICLTTSNAYASAQEGSISHFSQVAQEVNKLGDPQQTLVVFDDDDTLTRLPCANPSDPQQCQYLGGPAWFSWQQSLPINSSQRISPTFDGLLTDSTLIYSISNMTYTEPSVPSTLLNLSKEGAHILVETARDQSVANDTTRQFQALSVIGSPTITNFAQLIADNALKSSANLPSFASPYLPCNGSSNTRPVRYEQGVLYLAGQNKGQMLQCFLNKIQAKGIKDIVFLDDTQENVDNVYQAFKDNSNYNVIALHYSGLDQFKQNFTQGKMAATYQAEATHRWQAIKSTLEASLPKPNVAN